MSYTLLLISDIHGNFPALQAVEKQVKGKDFDHIINCGDSLVYAPFANETLKWLQQKNVLSILGNTDKKVIKLLRGKSFKKPGKEEKRVMYSSTAQALTTINRDFLLSFKKSYRLQLASTTIGVFHGSPAEHHEFLFDTSPDARFLELSKSCGCDIVITGHSHTPYHKHIGGVHFINPGSVGRMFDGTPKVSYAILKIDTAGNITVEHYRAAYDVEQVIKKLKAENLPEIYSQMYRLGRKLN